METSAIDATKQTAIHEAKLAAPISADQIRAVEVKDAARRIAVAASAARSTSPIYSPIAASLAAVERRLQSELQSRYEAISPILRHGIQLGGKRLRPALVLLSGAAIILCSWATITKF